MSKVLIENLTSLHHFDGNGNIFQKKNQHILIDDDGIIEKISDTPIEKEDAKLIQGNGLLGLPAFIDCHSHTLFAGNRANEFEMKCQGMGYLEIAKQGGGITATQNATAGTPDHELIELLYKRIAQFMSQGIHGLEIKTGYGLTHEEEIRHLHILKRVQEDLKDQIKIWITYLGAHAVLKSKNKDEYLEEICTKTIPLIAQEKLANFIDIFVDDGFFTKNDLQKVHQASADFDIPMKAHIDEIKNLGAADYAAEHYFISVDHCRHTTNEQLQKLADANVQVVFLPATSFYINEGFVTMEDVRKTGIQPAISLDYNPGSQPSLSWPFLLHVGMKKMGMTSEELLYATTIAPLHALKENPSNWCLEEGKKCKLTLFHADSISELAYRYGENLFEQGLIYL